MKIVCFMLAFFLGICTMNAGNDDIANFRTYENDNKRLRAEPNPGTRVVFMGNSIVQFWSSMRPGFFGSNDFIGRGIGGQTSYEMLMRFREDVVRLDPAGVIISAGTNDVAENLYPWYDEERTFGNIQSMTEIALANDIKVFLASVLPTNGFGWQPSVADYKEKIVSLNVRIKEYADSLDIPYIDYYSAMVNEEMGLKADLSDDGVHPNSEGYEIMERVVLPVVRRHVFLVSDIPEPVMLSGTAVFEEDPVTCSKISDSSYEAFLELRAGGELRIIGDNTCYTVDKEGRLVADVGDREIEPMVCQSDGVYCVNVDFAYNTVLVNEVTSMRVVGYPSGDCIADLSYVGGGCWEDVISFGWPVSGGETLRYLMVMTIGGVKLSGNQHFTARIKIPANQNHILI